MAVGKNGRGGVLYLGDGSLSGAASYLAGVMRQAGLRFLHRPSSERIAGSEPFRKPGLVILSDFPAAHLGPEAARGLLDAVREGCGLLMVGGWSSFRGLDGRWDKSPVAGALPVQMGSEDDRVNLDQGAFVRRALPSAHPVLAGLPWETHPPVIGGYNRFRAGRGSEVLLDTLRCRSRLIGGKPVLSPAFADPLLVTGAFGAGRTAALATDLAPHWVGPLVDWGPRRVRSLPPGGWRIEVGSHYARFIVQLLRWAGRL
jgi:hypothetical protein